MSKDFNIEQIRAQFPALLQQVHNKDLVYLDNAATTLKPESVINAISDYYLRNTANVHRGMHTLSENATKAYEESRDAMAAFINSPTREQLIITKGTTESINLVARSFGDLLSAGDEVIISELEHHSNIVPWQLLRDRKNIILKVIPINDAGEIELQALEKLLSNKTKLISVNHISNSLGTINPIEQIISMAKSVGAKVLIDGAQAVAHTKVDVQKLDCDFYAFSMHKLYGPTGVGALYGKKDVLESMPPFLGGGDMIDIVEFEKTTYNDLPYKFEAGTPNIAEVIGVKAAIDFANTIDWGLLHHHENELLNYATERVKEIKQLKIIGTAKNKTSILSFVIDGIHPHDVATFMDHQGVAVRTGHHCTQPVMKRMNVPATSRASFSVYNNKNDVDRFIEALKLLVDIHLG